MGTMGERRAGGQRDGGNPLVSGRGVTTVKSIVVQRIAGVAAQEVDGVHMGGKAARTTSRASGGRGSQDQTRGVSADVGRTEVAIDLTMALDYGMDVLQTVNRVRDRISSRVQPLTGLNVTEINVTVSDILFPEDGGRDATGDEADRTQAMPGRELRPGARERGYTETSPTERTRTEGGSRPEEEERAEGGPLKEDQTAELRLDKDDTERQPSSGEDEGERSRDRRR